ncbi:hypothetical protein HELRODRAFT_158712 [Helobdella robusta]|uniref:Uncharacterized protein n=1 Tax=Helobdella robusta TaxID=6412 RepID=T1EN55_HELRO|nr:hypothetical protein HELRODRAFT_158712 [Helobdella robusta]ESO12240.1 hypothetical protein HELRODRAFT_158712 [Helobdella robusta]
MPMCSISKCHGSYKDIGITLHSFFYNNKTKPDYQKMAVKEYSRKLLSNDQADTLSEMQSPIMMEKKSTDEPLLILKDNGGLVFPSCGVVQPGIDSCAISTISMDHTNEMIFERSS